MQRVKGKAGGGGAALGSSTVLRPPVGIPMVPARLIMEMQRRSRDSTFEPVDIVLVAERYSQAVGVTVPWGKIVGIVCQQEEAVEQGLIPTVTGVANLLQAVPDDTLLLVDGDRGTVLVEPDSMSVATYQAERERISPRRRLFLDFEHQPARTTDGREIHIAASIRDVSGAALAVNQGADSLFVPEDSGFLSPDQSDAEQVDLLLQLGRAGAGKPIMIATDLSQVSGAAALRAALRADLALALPLAAGAASFSDSRAYLEEVRVELTDQEVDFGDIRLAGRILAGQELPDDLAHYLIGRLILTGSDPVRNPLDAEWMADMVTEAAALLIPALGEVVEVTADTVSQTIGLGASGLIVPMESVAGVKEMVRQLEFAACRERAGA